MTTFQPLGDGVYRVTGAMPRSAVTGRVVRENLPATPDGWFYCPVHGDLLSVNRSARCAEAPAGHAHLPTLPDRETVLLALARADGQDWASIADASLHTAEIMYGKQADAVLALGPGRSEAEVKGEALREWVEDVTGDLAATKAAGIDLGRDYLHGMRSALMQATERADRIEAGADRG